MLYLDLPEIANGDPEHLSRQLVLLYDGAAATAHMDRDLEAPLAARALAERLLSSQISN